MNLILGIELLGLVSCCVGIWFTTQAKQRLTADGRLTLFVMFLLVGAVHLLDALEWAGNPAADRFGDIVKVFTPAAWLFFLFVVRRDGLLSRVAQQDEQLDFFFEHAPMAIAVLDHEDRYLACSRRWLELHKLQHFPRYAKLGEADSVWGELWLDVVLAVKKNAAVTSGTERLELSNGERWFDWKARPLHSAQGAQGMILIVDEVTERIHLEQQRELEQLRLMRRHNMETIGEIAAGVAHDVNNLLQVIGAHAAMFEDVPLGDAELRDSLDSIRAAVGSAAGMNRWLLSVGRRRATQFRQIDLCVVVGKVVQLLHRALPRSQRIVLLLPEQPVEVLADETQLEQLIINLVLNARDAMPQGGIVEVSVEAAASASTALAAAAPQGPVLRVLDHGPGIAAGLEQRIMEPWFTTKGDGGTGMGLAVVRRVAEAHAAVVCVSSEAGAGACFSVCFPALGTFTP